MPNSLDDQWSDWEYEEFMDDCVNESGMSYDVCECSIAEMSANGISYEDFSWTAEMMDNSSEPDGRVIDMAEKIMRAMTPCMR